MSNALTIQEMDKYANAIVKSGFCGFTKPEEVVTLALIAQDEGRSIGSVARDYHIIKGRPTLKADAMLARYQSAGGKVKWLELSNTRCAAEFTHESSGTFTLEWTFEQAKAAQLTGNPTWQKFPRAMLRARVISEGIRTSLPAVICGTYTPEEVEDMEERPAVHAPKAEQQKTKATVVEAEVVNEQPKGPTASQKFAKELNDMKAENPEAFEMVKESMTAHGWKKPSDIPPEEYDGIRKAYIIAKMPGPKDEAKENNNEKEANNG